MDISTLTPGASVLELKPGRARGTLPTPVLYMGLVPISSDGINAASSDAFKRQVRDKKGKDHMLPDATLSTLYLEVVDERRDALLAELTASDDS